MIPNIDHRKSAYFELSEATVKYFMLAVSDIEDREIENQGGQRNKEADEDKGGEEDGEGSGAKEEGGDPQDDRESAA